MAQLPNADRCKLNREKITDYLLSDNHPGGWAKARFFRRHGFARHRWTELCDALREHASNSSVQAETDTRFGKKYILEGPLDAPDGRAPQVRAVWFVPRGEAVPRFVTAYPLPGAR